MNRLAIALCLLASPIAAEELPYLQPADTRFGTLSVVDTQVEYGDAQQLLLNGAPIAGMVDRFVDLRALLPRPDGTADWALVSLSNGGNGCPTMWALVELSPAGATASTPFGTCAEEVLNLRLTDAAQVLLDMPNYTVGEDYATYRFDGKVVTETIVPYSNDGAVIAGAGDDVRRWSGGHPATPFEDAGERLRFAQLMSDAQVLDLAARVAVGSDTVTEDGWVIGQGFDPASGGDVSALWAIRIADGAPLAIFLDPVAQPQSFGPPLEEWPQAAIEYLGVP